MIYFIRVGLLSVCTIGFFARADVPPQRPQPSASIRQAMLHASTIQLKNEFCGSANASLRFCAGFDPHDGSYYIERTPKVGERLLLPVTTHGYDNEKRIAYYMGFDLSAVMVYSFSAQLDAPSGRWTAAYQMANPLGNKMVEQYQFFAQKM